jgi:hypothetical protein
MKRDSHVVCFMPQISTRAEEEEEDDEKEDDEKEVMR